MARDAKPHTPALRESKEVAERQHTLRVATYSAAIGAVAAIAAATVPAAIATYAAEKSRQRTEIARLDAEIDEKARERYEHLLRAIEGFAEGRQDATKKLEFGTQLRLCWLYCPDSVITRVNAFIDDSLKDADCGDRKCNTDDVTKRAQAFMVGIREHLFPESTLRDSDVRFFIPLGDSTPPPLPAVGSAEVKSQ